VAVAVLVAVAVAVAVFVAVAVAVAVVALGLTTQAAVPVAFLRLSPPVPVLATSAFLAAMSLASLAVLALPSALV